MKVIATKLAGLKIIEPKSFGDNRGFFFESFHAQRYQDSGMNLPMVQDNMSRSKYGVLRGLHYQLQYPQAKLVTVTHGEVFDIAVDIRLGSPTFGQSVGLILSDENHKQLYIPAGFAHGFCVLSDVADFHYKCTEYYHPEDEHSVIWNDSAIGIEWPQLTIQPILSDKDKTGRQLKDIPANNLPKFVNL